jgi:hypothetical protein
MSGRDSFFAFGLAVAWMCSLALAASCTGCIHEFKELLREKRSVVDKVLRLRSCDSGNWLFLHTGRMIHSLGLPTAKNKHFSFLLWLYGYYWYIFDPFREGWIRVDELQKTSTFSGL